VTFATIEAAAIDAQRASPLTTSSLTVPYPARKSQLPSSSSTSGRSGRASTARRAASRMAAAHAEPVDLLVAGVSEPDAERDVLDPGGEVLALSGESTFESRSL
jgi:hypothetical protein